MKIILLCDKNVRQIAESLSPAEAENFKRIIRGDYVVNRSEQLYFCHENPYPPILNHVHTEIWTFVPQSYLESNFDYTLPDDHSEWFEITRKF